MDWIFYPGRKLLKPVGKYLFPGRTSNVVVQTQETLRLDSPPARTLRLDSPPARTLRLDSPPARTLRLDSPPVRTLRLDSPPATTLRLDPPPNTTHFFTTAEASVVVYESEFDAAAAAILARLDEPDKDHDVRQVVVVPTSAEAVAFGDKDVSTLTLADVPTGVRKAIEKKQAEKDAAESERDRAAEKRVAILKKRIQVAEGIRRTRPDRVTAETVDGMKDELQALVRDF